MKKFEGFTQEEVNNELKWVARHSTGHRFVGTYSEIEKHCEMYEDDEWDYIKDIDVVCSEGQTPAMAKFLDAYEALIEKHGWMTIPELFEKYGKDE